MAEAGPLCPTAAHRMVVSRCQFTCNSCRQRHVDGESDHWACAACGDDFCFECRPPSEAGEGAEPVSTARKRRWAERLEAARSMLTTAASNARPVSSRVAALAKRSGEIAGGAIKTGGILTGAAVAGLGVVAFGGVAGAALVAGGGMAAAAGYVGGSIVETVGDGTAQGITLSGVITEKSLTVSSEAMSAVKSMLTKSQAELLLGEEGAAVLSLIMQMWETERQSIDGLQDISYAQVAQGVVALCCLQRVQRVHYGSKGFQMHRALHGAQNGDEAEDWKWEDGPANDYDGPEALRRSMHIASLCYPVVMDLLIGSGTTGTKALFNSRQEALVSALELDSHADILAAQWETTGPHCPGYLLIADRKQNASTKGVLVLAIRGTMTAGDALTDLRCDSAPLSSSFSPGIRGESVHRGMWESAVRLDGTLRHVIEQALEPGGVCEGMQLRLVGHSLGAGVASLLTLRWRELVPLFNSHGLHCHAFGPPCTLGASAAEATAAYITSVVVGDDAVCRWSLGSTKDVLQAAAILALERGATQRLLRMALASIAMPEPLSPRPNARSDTANAGDRENGQHGNGTQIEEDAVMDDVGGGGGGGVAGEGELIRGKAGCVRQLGEQTAAAWDVELVASSGGAGADAEQVGERGGWVASAAALAAAPLTSPGDMEWSRSTLRSLESLVEASQAEKLLPAGRILWMLRPYAAGADGACCKSDETSQARHGSEGGTAALQGARGGLNSTSKDDAQGERPQEPIRPQEFKTSRTTFGKIVFSRSLLTDHMPMSYLQALDGESARPPACL